MQQPVLLFFLYNITFIFSYNFLLQAAALCLNTCLLYTSIRVHLSEIDGADEVIIVRTEE